MGINRRDFLSITGIAAAALSAGVSVSGSSLPTTMRASRGLQWLVFDAFPIFDARPVDALAESMFPGAGLGEVWRNRQFEYAWLRVATRHYADFWQVTRDALGFAMAMLKLKATQAQMDALMQAYLSLRPLPDVIPVLSALKQAGLRFAFLSNFTMHMLEANIRSAGLDGFFERVLSSDQVETYKPDPRAYQLAMDELHAAREEILFVAFGGWDAVGAKLFGYPTFWFNPKQLPPEKFGPVADGMGSHLNELVQFVERTKSG